MKRQVALLFSAAMLLAAGELQAAAKYGMAGCGLGSIVMGPRGSQVTAATTNNTGVQTFGITSGTSNCEPGDKMAMRLEQQQFINTNLASLSKEMAQGNGDTLAAFASTLRCESKDYGTFTRQLKDSYTTIFAAPGALAVLDVSKEQLKSNPVLAQSCKGLI